MDGNKLKKLKEVNWKIVKTCSSCKYGKFDSSPWGLCAKLTYIHGTHKREHKVPAHVTATCNEWTSGATYESMSQWLKSEVTS